MSDQTDPLIVTMTQDQLAEALADLERLAKSGGLSADDIAEVYQERIEDLDAQE